jgi:hypothetical protein
MSTCSTSCTNDGLKRLNLILLLCFVSPRLEVQCQIQMQTTSKNCSNTITCTLLVLVHVNTWALYSKSIYMMAKKSRDKEEPDRVLIVGKPDLHRCDNKIVSARYSPLTFLPVVRHSLPSLDFPCLCFSADNDILILQ